MTSDSDGDVAASAPRLNAAAAAAPVPDLLDEMVGQIVNDRALAIRIKKMATRILVREVVDRLLKDVVRDCLNDTVYDADKEDHRYGPFELSPGVFYNVQEDEYLHLKKF